MMRTNRAVKTGLLVTFIAASGLVLAQDRRTRQRRLRNFRRRIRLARKARAPDRLRPILNFRASNRLRPRRIMVDGAAWAPHPLALLANRHKVDSTRGMRKLHLRRLPCRRS